MRLITQAAAAAAVVLVAFASQAAAQAPEQPTLPDIPTTDVARFKMTIDGLQRGEFSHSWTPGNACNWHSEGTLVEQWEFQRGKAVVMEFSRLAPRVILLRRAGRPAGDSAFAAPGFVTREGTGFFDMGPEGCGGMHSLVSPDCGKRFPVKSDLRLLWLSGKLRLERSGATFRANPAEDCGTPDGALNFNGLTAPYPILNKQIGKLTAAQIFGKRRGLKVKLKAKFIEPLRDRSEWPNAHETLTGLTHLTFKRLPDR
jgi:hypothetical protein